MKNELGITKGEWIISDLIQDDGMYVYSTRNRLSAILRIYKGENPNAEQAESNAKLIAEAGTVANETGKTPRQLADDNKVLLEALQNMRVMYWQWIEQHPETQGYKWAKEALSAIKQVTE